MSSFVVKNNAESLVADNPLGAGVTTLNVTASEGANFPSTFPFLITLWDETAYPDPTDDSGMEICRCTARTTDALTIVRAQEGTGDVAHALGERVAMLITAGIFTDPTYGAMRKDASIWLGAEGAYLPATNPAALIEVAGATVYGGWSYLAFDDTTSEHAVWRVPMPDYDGGNIVVRGFAKVATSPATPKDLQYNILTIGLTDSEEFNAASTSDTGVNLTLLIDASGLPAKIWEQTATIDPANVAADDLMVIELARDVASDDLPGDGQLVGILLEYTKA